MIFFWKEIVKVQFAPSKYKKGFMRNFREFVSNILVFLENVTKYFYKIRNQINLIYLLFKLDLKCMQGIKIKTKHRPYLALTKFYAINARTRRFNFRGRAFLKTNHASTCNSLLRGRFTPKNLNGTGIAWHHL